MIEQEVTVGDYLNLVKWYENLPDTLKTLVSRFYPGSKWKLKGKGLRVLNGKMYGKADYLMPESFSRDGVVTVVHCDGVTGAVKQYLELNPKLLVPVVVVVEGGGDGARRQLRNSTIDSI